METLAAELRAKHGTLCRIVPADLEQDAQVTALCEALADERIDLFINNAGFGACGAFSETDAGKELSMLRVNVLAITGCSSSPCARWKPRALAPS